MKRKVYFCKSWFRAKKCPIENWSSEQAKTAHDQGLPYTVLVDSVEQPYCFLEVTENAVGVGFLDEKLRESLTYGFQKMESGGLFLTMATYREFINDTDRVANGTSYTFDRNGAVSIQRDIFSPEHKVETSSSVADVTGNYCAMPVFGEYDELIRVERE